MNPSDLKYSEDHEWVRIGPDNTALIGITEFAAESLGDVVFVELPDAGVEIVQFDQFGEIESVKAVSELYSPVSGSVLENNPEVITSPEKVNESPYDEGWLLKIQLNDISNLDKLMSVEEYDSHLSAEGK